MAISFKINGNPYSIKGEFGPDVTLNEYIRNVADLRGTKYMCREGGCGACVVAVKAPHPVTLEVQLFSVNSCLVSVLSCHGWEILTTEGIGNKIDGYHEIQTRLAKFNGTQCGYCTPGWVMNMYSLYGSKNRKLSMKEIENSFAGNICRCTGYRAIADAFKSFAADAEERLVNKVCDLEDLASFKNCGVKCSKGTCCHTKKTPFIKNVLLGRFESTLNIGDAPCKEDADADWCVLDSTDNKMIVIDCGTHKWYKAYNLKDVYDVMGQGNDYKLIAGNTGQGVYHVNSYPKNVIDISNVSEIKSYMMDINLIIGAGMPLNEMMTLFLKLSSENPDFSYLKQFYDHMDLVAHIPVRNIGTIAGNLGLKNAHNEFQSDVFLLFETVGAMLTIGEGVNKTRQVTMTEFLTLDMKGRIIINVMLPPLSHCCLVKTYKIMPRAQNAHAVVNAGFLFKINDKSKLIDKATLVFGSISPKFIHASRTEALLVGKDLFTNETLQAALKSLESEIKPEPAPPEPSVAYRKMLALSLFYKAVLYLCPADRLDKRYRSGGEAIKRILSHGTQTFDTDKSVWPVSQPIPKLEALTQCSGEAIYANDLPTQNGELFAAFVTADQKPGSVISGFDASEALKMPGVVAFYTAKDIPGANSFTVPTLIFLATDEEILCSKTVKYYGQPAAIIVANREQTAYLAAERVKITYSMVNSGSPLITVEDVLKSPEKSKRVSNNATIQPKETGKDIKTVLYGEYRMESQYHYSFETQTCVTKPTEDGMDVYSATQWLDLTNVAISRALNIPNNKLNVMVRRLGGAYGAKISRSTQISCAAALVTHLTGKTCRMVLPIEKNISAIGKRCPNSSTFEVGVNANGQIQYLKTTFYQDKGCYNNEIISPLIVAHLYNCYDPKRWYVEANSVVTDTASNTWCRAPASTEGLAIIEYIMERIAYNIGKDPIEVRLENMRLEDNSIPEMIERIKVDSSYEERSAAVRDFNRNNRWRKKAIKLLPMSYHLFYFGNFYATVGIYHGDGTVTVRHSGIEMGQGINTKIAQVVAYKLDIPIEKVTVKPSDSTVTPNAVVTGGSIGSECVSLAAVKACDKLLERLKPVREKIGKASWETLVEKAYTSGVDLLATHMLTPGDGTDLKEYNIFGVVVIEIELDALTGNHDILRVDLLEDTGRSLSPVIDVGQIEGAFVMGLGYWTSEKLIYDERTGQCLTDRTWTYKPPGIKDIPADMRIYFKRNGDNPSGVLQSKATGEPAFCLAVVITHALREAVRAVRAEAGYPDQWVDISNPCTVENIYSAIQHKLDHFKLN